MVACLPFPALHSPTLPYTHLPAVEPTLPYTHLPTVEPTLPYTYLPAVEPTLPYTHLPAVEPDGGVVAGGEKVLARGGQAADVCVGATALLQLSALRGRGREGVNVRVGEHYKTVTKTTIKKTLLYI